MSQAERKGTGRAAPRAMDATFPARLAKLTQVIRHPLTWITLVALAVRLYHLTYHSLWFDEVMSTFWAAKPAGEIWRVGLSLTQDKHPPLYYLMLHGWTLLWGSSDYAVRLLGVVIGALAVLPAYGIGRVLGGRRAAAAGALLLAVNPFLVWYSQEARMFMPATTFGLAGMYGIVQIHYVDTKNKTWYCILAVLGFASALYTYLFSAFLLPVAGAWLAIAWWLHRCQTGAGRRFWLGVLVLLATTLLFLPLAKSAWLVSGNESTPGRPFEGMFGAIWRLLPIYTIGWPHWPRPLSNVVSGVAGLLAVAGVVAPAIRRMRREQVTIQTSVNPASGEEAAVPGASGLLLLWLGLPVLAGGVLLARDRSVFAETRYYIFLVPALCLAWGQALAALWQWCRPLRRPIGMAGMALVLGVTLVALPTNWTPKNRREAWRDAAAYIQAHAGAHDAILIQADYVHVAFERYYTGTLPIFYPFIDRLTDGGQIEGPLSGLAAYDAVWLVQSHQTDQDPNNLVAGWFAARYPAITEIFPPGIAIRGFATRYRSPLDIATISQQDGRKWPALRLLSCDYTPGRLSPKDDLLHPPSNWVHVTTRWTILAPLSEDIYPEVRIVDGAGQVWGEKLDRRGDAIHIWPTSRWLSTEQVRVDYDVNLNPITPPGTYNLTVQIPGADEPSRCGEVIITR